MSNEKDIIKQEILNNLKNIAPNIEIASERFPSFYYYTPSIIMSKMVIEKNTRNIYLKDIPEKLIKDKYLTENEAIMAISRVMPDAVLKFQRCLEAFNELKQKMAFGVGFSYEGDSYGIYNESSYISFKIDEFYFSFEIED